MPIEQPEKFNILWDPREPRLLRFEDGSTLRGPSIRIEEAPDGGHRAVIWYRASGGYSELYAEAMAMKNEVGNDVVQH